MKRFLAIPAFAIAAIALSSCGDIGRPGTSTTTWIEDMLVEIVERPIGGSVVTTTLEWDEHGAQKKETQTSSAGIVYEDEFESGTGSYRNVRTRTIYNPDGTTYKQRRELSYVEIGGRLWESVFNAYNLDDNGNTIRPAVESFEYEYDEVGNPRTFKRWENGVLVRRQYGFEYNFDEARFWQQNSEDETDLQRMYHKSTTTNDRFDGGYRLYVIIDPDKDDERTLIEEKKIDNQSDFNQSYTITRWDPETGEETYKSSFQLTTREFTFTW